mmetsp:Transcript_69225/g.165999  ORF Transcript_69225/g.165999 Transcript_69225/m.165999 type:complete len:144 (-) Transcript_69225:97-528(-)|eukprot:CAMPEP_0178409202 /NCGR_PEP_ID=MMETSP0689_2-20121128/20341_1 /TAXON_ID=160604 /ORGANISM="Amphidinium massartii, Strain CS-259" /LENGTH=143 /DNA_ID=CAMNT_0020030337 /DNA_START=49 /DNA_END=480 /DNA_ORIENTATION=-
MAAVDLIQALVKRTKRPEAASAVLDTLKTKPSGKLPVAVLRVSRPKAGSNAPHGDFVYDLVLPYLVAYISSGQLADLSISADPFVAFPSANFVLSKGVKLVREGDDTFAGRSVTGEVVTLDVRTQTAEEVLAWLDSHSAKSKL